MSQPYIDVQPNMYQGFLKIFDLVMENGDIGYHLQRYKGEQISADDIAKVMVMSGWGVFGVASKVPELVEKMKMEIIKQDDHHFVVFRLAPFLGLPGNDFATELQELKSLLTWIKDEALAHPQHDVKLCLERLNKTDASVSVFSSHEPLEKELQQKFDDRITQSEVLKAWVENQKLGFIGTEKQCFNLWITMHSMSLMNREEIELLLNAEEQEKSNNKSRGQKRKNGISI